MSLTNCRVVLVRPQFAGNVGATARVMRNMGLKELVLVAPEADIHDRQARQLSTHGEFILDQARIVDSLSAAVGDCLCVVGTSARTGKLIRGQFGPPDVIVPRLVTGMAGGLVALVFGPETNGLMDTEITLCHHVLSIPADPTYSALNLGQSVAICLYELRRRWLQAIEIIKPPEPAPFEEQERMFLHLRTALEQIHFLYGPKADVLMHGLRQMLGRAQPTEMEVGLLHGLARQIEWFITKRKKS